MNIFQKFIGHTKTVHQHRKAVRKLCFKCGLYWQGLTHDLSKYSPIEFWNGVKYYTGTSSPHVGERADKGFSEAWIHHHNRNKHHAEYWQDINKEGKSYACPMPDKYLKEMVCDRVAACMIYMKDKYDDIAPLNYYNTHKDENQFNIETREKLEEYLNLIANKGFENAMKGN
jgi:hypothetical protein